MYDLELEKVRQILLGKAYTKIALQLPDGMLKEPLLSILDTISFTRESVEVFILGDPCFGACDLGVQQAISVGCEALFHFGHAPLPLEQSFCEDLDIYFFEGKVQLPIQPILEKIIVELKKKQHEHIALTTTIQHHNELRHIEEKLQKNGFKVYISKKTKRLKPGQVLGCDIGIFNNINSKQIDSTIFIGGGRFHPLAILRKTKKPVICADPFFYSVEILDTNELQVYYRKRYAAVNAIKNAGIVGILCSSKIGQFNEKLVKKAQKWLKRNGKKFLTVLVSTAFPQHLSNYQVDGWISTLCPRVALDDYEQYYRPIVNFEELDWEKYVGGGKYPPE